jgi:hypothetical protein
MVDKVDSQFVEFKGANKVEKSGQKTKELMDVDTENALVESTKNFNKLVNNMFNECSKLCINNFAACSLSTHETICVENCQKKFFTSYAIGQQIVNAILAEANKADMFSDNTDINIIQNSLDKIQNNKTI